MSDTTEYEPRSHFILYAKGWYKRSDSVIGDLKHIVGNYTDCDPEFVDIQSVMYHLYALIHQYYDMTSLHRFMELFNSFKYERYDASFSMTEITKKQINHYLSIISNFKVVNDDKSININIANPDWSILPPAHDDSQVRWESMHSDRYPKKETENEK